MNNRGRQLNQSFIDSMNNLAKHGFQSAAEGFSDMIGVPMAVYKPSVTLLPLNEVPRTLGGADIDAVGIYIKVTGGISGHMLLIMPYDKSLETVDRLLDARQGTTEKLGPLERSALAEMGNLTGSFFINAISDQIGLASYPSPPAVIVDMVEAILAAINAMVGNMGQDVLLFQATFMVGDREMNTDFWVIFDPNTLDKLIDELN
jgi:chemotaxis protein CheC